MGIELLGSLRVDGDEVSLQRRDRVVLSALAVRAGEVLSADQLAEALWGEAPPASWPKQIHGSVLRVRRALGSTVIETTAAGYRLAVVDGELDCGRFEELVARAELLAADGEFDRAAVAYERALGLWRGPPFEVLDGWSPARIEAARLEEVRLAAEESLLDVRLASGGHREVVAAAEARVAEQPLREHRWAILATALYRCGRQADALRALKQARRSLVEQLGIEPSVELVALESAILRQDEALLAVVVPPTISEQCPYKGLAAYDVDDTDSFFGRDNDVAACVERLDAHPLLVVTGPSGCGKSSLVRAGLIPALQRAGRTVAVFMPGTDPNAAMTNALASTDAATPMLVVDQFEELFTFDGDTSTRAQRFCARLAAYAVDTAPVVAVVRADHLAATAADPGFARLAEHGIHLVTPLTGDSLRAAIEGPAALAGLRLEHGLVDLLVRDCEGAPGALPLLSHALAETWQRRDGRVLTVEGYRATGEIRGAVARSADRLYESLPAEQRPKLRSVMLRLVSPALDGEPVRSRVATRVLAGDADREQVVALLARARLVTTEQDTVELAHEALARAWPRLRSWLDEDAAGQRILRHLSTAADGWESLGRPTSELYRGARLEAALEWRTATSPDLTEQESAFLDASIVHAATEREELAERARRQARENRRLRGALAAIAALLVVALVGGFVAVDQRRDAQQERRRATARELAAAAEANLAEDPERSILLALAAIDETRSVDGTVLPQAEEALHRAVTASRIVLSVPDVGGSLDWSSDGDVFVTEGPEETGIVDVRDATTGESVLSFHGHDIDVNDVAFSADGSMLATTGDDGAVRVWDPETGEELLTVPGDGVVWYPNFSADGSRLLAGWLSGWPRLVRVTDLTTGDEVSEFELPRGGGAALSPDGARVVLDLRVLDARSGDEVVVLDGEFDWADPYRWSPDGKWIAAATVTSTGDASQTQIWDATTGERYVTLDSGNVGRLAWSPDSSRLATSSHDGTARVWEIDAGSARELFRFSAQDLGSMGGVAFSPDGARLMVGDSDITAVKIFDLSIEGGREWATVPDGVPGLPGGATFTSDGRQLVTSSEDAAAVFWDAERGNRIRSFGAAKVAVHLEASPDGRLVAGSTVDALPVSLWDTETGGHVASVLSDRPDDGVWGLAWSPDGAHLAIIHGPWEQREVSIVDRAGAVVTSLRPEEPGAAFMSVSFSADGRLLATTQVGLERPDPAIEHVSIWDWAGGEVVRTIDTQAATVAFDPTGDRLVSGRFLEGVLDVWDTDSGERLTTLAGHTGLVRDLTFSRDGSKVATASEDGTARVWDPATGSQLQVLRTDSPLATVVFSPDGSKLASVGTDGIVRVWALDLDDLIAIATDRLTRRLSDDECRRYLHIERCPQT